MLMRRRKDTNQATTSSGDGWPLRPVIVACVILIHAGLLALLLRPWTMPRRDSSLSLTDNVIQVRFIPLEPPAKVSPPAHAQHPSTRVPRPRTTHQVKPAKQDVELPGAANQSVTSPVSVPTIDRVPSYVAGAESLSGNVPYGHQSIRIPGTGAAPGAPHFRMIDPRDQGIAGVIHFIGGLTGAIDPHCLDLEALLGMTPEERVAHHVGASEMELLEASNDCPRARRRVGTR